MKGWTFLAAALALTACASREPRPDDASTAGDAKEKSYQALVETYSAGDREYNGFYNQFDFRATLQNSAVQAAMLAKQAEYYQWDAAKKETERAKAEADMSRETVVFCSFFTPDRRNDNLADSKSIWRVYLDVDGRRYVAKIKKSRKLIAELQALFPYHTRWTTPYVFTFPVPASAVERAKSKLTITGPLAARSVEFAPVNAVVAP